MSHRTKRALAARIWPIVVDFDHSPCCAGSAGPFDSLRSGQAHGDGFLRWIFRPGSKAGPRGESGLGLDRSLVNEHDGNVVFYPIHAMAVRAFQGFRILTIIEGLFALRTN
jgi:hypothetical protein